MAKIHLITGGSRSGKSSFAQTEAEKSRGRKLFIATCPKVDSELDNRIARHQQDRQGKGWHTLEEELNLANAIKTNHSYTMLLVDCLTLWINNHLYHRHEKGLKIDEGYVTSLCHEVIEESKKHPGTIIFVTNEVGSGIVPESDYTRLYRDLVGRCNQLIAAAADHATLVCCGLPLTLK